VNWFTRRRADPLTGRWVIDPSDISAVAELGHVEIEFNRGRLRYEIHLADRKQVMLMTYRVEGDVLVTDQPSHLKPERTAFALQGDALTLAFGGVSSRFLRRQASSRAALT
jgi:hypothetical protein